MTQLSFEDYTYQLKSLLSALGVDTEKVKDEVFEMYWQSGHSPQAVVALFSLWRAHYNKDQFA